MMNECEIRDKTGQWLLVEVANAHEFPQVIKRCKHCHGQVHLYPASPGSNVSVPYFGHDTEYAGCPNSMHPEAIE